MEATIYRRYGGSEVLEYVSLPNPKLGHIGVLGRKHAGTLNPAAPGPQADVDEAPVEAPVSFVATVLKQVRQTIRELALGQAVLHTGAPSVHRDDQVVTIVQCRAGVKSLFTCTSAKDLDQLTDLFGIVWLKVSVAANYLLKRATETFKALLACDALSTLIIVI